MNKHSVTNIFVIVLFFSITLVACSPGEYEENTLWQRVSSPPGYDGSCHAYFITEGILDAKYGFSSVWCGPLITDNAEVIQLEWEKVPNPPAEGGRCYGYFITKGILDTKYGFSGTWCY